MAHARPELLDALVDINARAVAAYLEEQIVAGADAVMIFDTWGGLLTRDAYRRFSLRPVAQILAHLSTSARARHVPTIVFTKGAGGRLDDLAGIGADAVGLDWTVDIANTRAAHGTRVALQGNLDPVVLTTDPATVAREAERIVRAAGAASGHVFNLGHGILPRTPPEHVAVLVETVHRVSRSLRS
jgi:uroporphyrinogen decarboxylase